MIALARAFSKTRHEGQFRRDNKTPYFEGHIEKVVVTVIALLNELGFVQTDAFHIKTVVLAYLHDVVEDKRATLEEIELIFGKEITELVALLIIDKSRDYHDQVRELAVNYSARLVKLSDNLVNISDTPTEKQKIKYVKSIIILFK